MGSTPGGNCSPVGTSPSIVSCHGKDWSLGSVDDGSSVRAREDCRASATYILDGLTIGHVVMARELVGDGVQ